MKKYRHLAVLIVTVIISAILTPSYGHTDVYTDDANESINATYDLKEVERTSIPTLTPLVITEQAITVEPTTIEPTIEPTVEPCPYDKEELSLLAHLINAEAGSDWCTDDMQYYVGSVVLNRMASDRYPDTMYDVIYQKGQYACINNGHINKTPCDRAWEIAEDLLVNGSVLPSKVVYQAEFRQGKGTYCIEQNMYFCY